MIQIKIIGYFLISLFCFVAISFCSAEPIVIKGSSVQNLLGCKIKNIRMQNRDGKSVIFQIDEMTSDGEYICPEGDEPNTDDGDGRLDPQDEIVFLSEDCQDVISEEDNVTDKKMRIKIKSQGQTKEIYLCCDSSLSVSHDYYIDYNHQSRTIETPWYYAVFGENRFHFVNAGVKNINTGKYIDLTNELRIKIFLRALWGLIPIRYSEDNMVCLVKRFKCGPLRLIRRGDFHLNLGLGLRGSRAIVNQICYPQIIKVPVYVHAPVRFGAFFRDAYIEMTPVLKKVDDFSFNVPKVNFSEKISGKNDIDTFIEVSPNNQFMAVSDGRKGYGWVLDAKIADQFLENSGFIFRRPSERNGFVDCGFRMNIHNLPKGYYEITNWVLFQSTDYSQFRNQFKLVVEPALVCTPDGEFFNVLSASSVLKKPKRRSK